jgi:hypothetical protein
MPFMPAAIWKRIQPSASWVQLKAPLGARLQSWSRSPVALQPSCFGKLEQRLCPKKPAIFEVVSVLGLLVFKLLSAKST